MIEDFNRLVELLLPTSIRQSKLIALLRALISTPLQKRFSDFNLFRFITGYESTVTPQVCSLIDAVQRRFDCVCDVAELDGKPYDFLVSIDRSTDLQAIKEFVDTHKLAGKSFVFELGDTAFTATWINYVNENLIELYSAEWIDYVSEDDGIIYIMPDVLKDVSSNSWIAKAYTSAPVASQLYIFVTVNYRTDSYHLAHAGSATVVVPTGQTTAETPIQLVAESEGKSLEIMASVSPQSDATYTYQITNTNL